MKTAKTHPPIDYDQDVLSFVDWLGADVDVLEDAMDALTAMAPAPETKLLLRRMAKTVRHMRIVQIGLQRLGEQMGGAS